MNIIIIILQLLSGISDGVREQVLYHPNELFIQHPNLTRQWWDSRISWQNKYNNHLPVALTDANHLFKASTMYLDIVSISISTGDLRVKTIAKKFITALIARKFGFWLMYNIHL